MNVLSLFDGMSCGHLALDRAGIPVDTYYASEIDKHAIAVTMHNYPDTVQLGDVTQWREWDLPKIDLLIGGSPCQGFSLAGKQLAFDDPRSKLFFEFVACLKHFKPTYFLLENVRMKKEHMQVITDMLGVEPIMINSNLVSAQNRVRYYWTNIPNIAQPADKGIMLKDVTIEGRPEDALQHGWAAWWARNADYQLQKQYSTLGAEKAGTLTARQYASYSGNFWFQALNEYIVPFDKTLHILDKEVARGKVGYFRRDSQANRVYYVHDKAVTLCGDAGGGAAKMGQYLFGCITPDRVEKRQNDPRFSAGDKFYTLTAQDKHGILVEGYIRKLTPLECERLQTVPEGYTSLASNAQRYRMLGNGWTVDVVAHIFKNIPDKNRQTVHYVVPYCKSTKEKPMATTQPIKVLIAETRELLLSRMEQSKRLRVNLRLLRISERDNAATDGAAYRRAIAEALAEIKLDTKALKDEIDAWDETSDELEASLIQSLAMTKEKHVAYADLGTLTVTHREHWQIEGDLSDPEAKARAEKAFFDFLDKEVHANNLSLVDAMNLRQNRFSAKNLEEIVDLYASQEVKVPGVKKVLKPTISFRKA